MKFRKWHRKARRLLARLLFALLLATAPVLMRGEDITMNFREVEIRQIIESVGRLTGRNFLVDPRVRGKVTILANEPVPEEAVYEMLLAILRMHGFRAIEGNRVTRIVAANVANRFAPNSVPAELVTELLRINHLNAGSVIPLVKPLMTPQSQIVAHKETNVLIITELKTNLDRIRSIIARLDLETVGKYEVIPLQHANAKDLVALLQKASNKGLRHLTQIVADRRTNRLIITGPPELRLPLRTLIAELDAPAEGQGKGELKVIALHYSKAEDMVKILKGLLASEQFLKLLVEGYLARELDTRTRPTVIIKPKDIMTTSDEKTASSIRNIDKKQYTIHADIATNSLIVGGTPPIIRAVERVVEKLDVPRPQVMIEAIIADVDESKFSEIESRIGVFDPGSTFGSITPANYRGILGIFNPDGEGSATFGGVARSSLSGGGTLPISLLVTAINRDNDSRVLSTPAILTLNNEEASIDVSDVRYVQTGQTSNSAGTTASVGRQEFGTKLTVTPQITEGSAVRLDIEQKHEDITGNTTIDNASYPVTKKREIKTRVVVNDGNILVLGGLTSDTVVENRRRTPFLGDLPIIGKFFSGQDSRHARQSLMVFIKPTILRTAAAAVKTSEDRYAELRLDQLLHASGLKSLLEKQPETAILPPLQKISRSVPDGTKKQPRKIIKIIRVKKRLSARKEDLKPEQVYQQGDH